jgi:Ala-tRNA(Pro) deacylase
VVVLKVNERFVMAVLPADLRVDLRYVRDVFWTPHVRLATEEEFRGLFPGCDLGAMPPFGNLYGMDVYVDGCLTTNEHIVFQAGTYSEAIKLAYGTFVSLVHPFVAELHEPYPWAKAG